MPLGLLLILTMVTAGCGVFKSSAGPKGMEVECAPGAPVGSLMPRQAEGEAVDSVARSALGIATTLQLGPLLEKMAGFEREVVADEGTAVLNVVKLHQQLLSRTLLVSFEISGVVGEVDCNRTRLDTIVDSLEKAQSTRSSTETAASVILSGVTNILTGGFTLAGNVIADAIAAITGGTVAGGLGVLAVTSQTSYDLKHERNLLREVWKDPGAVPRLSPKRMAAVDRKTAGRPDLPTGTARQLAGEAKGTQ